MPGGIRSAVLQPHGDPHLADGPIGTAGRGTLPLRPKTARLLAGYCEVPAEELNYWVAGINHQAWFLTLAHRGTDLYPRLRSHLDNPETLALEPVRFELMRRFGYFVTESSGHASEYLPYFRKRPDLLASLVETFKSAGSDYSAWFGYGQTGGCVASMRLTESAYEQEVDRQVAGTEPIVFRRSDEYGARIIHCRGNRYPPSHQRQRAQRRTHHQPACRGVRRSPLSGGPRGCPPLCRGSPPPQLASLNRSNIAVQELVVKGHLERDREAIYQAMALDPLTAAVCSLDEIWKLTDDMFEANEVWLKQFA